MESMLDTTSSPRGSKDFGNGQVKTFLESVEHLTKALKDVETPEIARLRAKVKIALTAAQSAVADTASQLRSQARVAGKRTDVFVRDNPWQVVGIAAVLGLAVGLLVTRRAAPNQD